MSFTAGQYNLFKNHVNLTWLQQNAKRNVAVSQDIIKKKITEAIESVPQLRGRATDVNIAWVANQVGTPWGNVHASPAAVIEGKVASEAMKEIQGNDTHLAQALRMVFNRTASGRTAPGTTGINHIHVGGNAQLNLLFDVNSATVLGLVNGHMDGNMSPSIRSEAARVTQRKGKPTSKVRILGSMITSA